MNRFQSVSALAGAMAALFVGALFVWACAFWAFGGAVHPGIFWAALASTLIFAWFWPERGARAAGTALFGVLLVGTLAIAPCYLDVSWDGQASHGEAILQLAQGWNPYYESLPEPANPYEKNGFFFATHLPKSAEAAWASVNALTGTMESGKALNLLLMAAAFGLAFAAWTALGLRSAAAAGAAALTAFSPPAVCQMFSYYLDGLVASSLACQLSLLVLYWKRPARRWLVALAVQGVFFLNLKASTPVFYVFLASGFVSLVRIATGRPSAVRKSLAGFALVFLAGTALFGCNPYVQNFQRHGHPLFPLYGRSGDPIVAETMKRISGNVPTSYDFQERTGFEKLLLSIFAESQVGTEFHLKLPLTVGKKEMDAFGFPDPRIGGLGPFFSAIFILAFAVALAGLADRRGNRLFFLFVLFAAGSIVLHPGAFWARYVPQLWLLPLAVFCLTKTGPLEKWTRLAAFAGLLLMAVNAGWIFKAYVRVQGDDTRHVREQLKVLREGAQPVPVDFRYFRANRERFRENGIHFVETDPLPEPTRALYRSEARVPESFLPREVKKS